MGGLSSDVEVMGKVAGDVMYDVREGDKGMIEGSV